jgi:hypothetical protein
MMKRVLLLVCLGALALPASALAKTEYRVCQRTAKTGAGTFGSAIGAAPGILLRPCDPDRRPWRAHRRRRRRTLRLSRSRMAVRHRRAPRSRPSHRVRLLLAQGVRRQGLRDLHPRYAGRLAALWRGARDRIVCRFIAAGPSRSGGSPVIRLPGLRLGSFASLKRGLDVCLPELMREVVQLLASHARYLLGRPHHRHQTAFGVVLGHGA